MTQLVTESEFSVCRPVGVGDLPACLACPAADSRSYQLMDEWTGEHRFLVNTRIN